MRIVLCFTFVWCHINESWNGAIKWNVWQSKLTFIIKSKQQTFLKGHLIAGSLFFFSLSLSLVHADFLLFDLSFLSICGWYSQLNGLNVLNIVIYWFGCGYPIRKRKNANQTIRFWIQITLFTRETLFYHRYFLQTQCLVANSEILC